MSLIDKLTPYDNLFSDSIDYSIEEAKSKFEVVNLDNNRGWLLLDWDENKLWLSFALLQFSFSDDTGTFGDVVFYGEGPSGSLRECRHTYWGKEGYLFYPNGKLISLAFKELSKYFNDLV